MAQGADTEKHLALVTGASSGIGRAISRELARRGHDLFLVSNEKEKLAEAAAEIEAEFHVKTLHLFCDLACRNSAQELFDYCTSNNIIVSILVNNAGIFFFRDVTNTAPERIETMLNLHVFTPTLLCRFFSEQMILENRRGYILNMASIAAWMMMPGLTLYNSTKSYVRCFSRAMRNEVYTRGIGITTVCPGAVATGLYNLPEKYLNLGIRLGIIITPEKLAQKALNKMFKKRAEYIPGGLLNRLFICIIQSLPERLIRRIKRYIDQAFSKT